jgi:ABC-type transport system substrate-binding protein
VAQAAALVKSAAEYLGIPIVMQAADPAEARYAVFHDGGYDLAILGWRLSAYPGYLCDWFGDDSPFGYHNFQVGADCQTLESALDLETARSKLFAVQAAVAQDLPLIPLYSGMVQDAVRGVRYPFEALTGGLGSVYGAPALAMPAAP